MEGFSFYDLTLRSYRYLRFPTALPGVIPAQAGIQSGTRCGLGATLCRGRFETAPYVRRHDKRCVTSVMTLHRGDRLVAPTTKLTCGGRDE